MPRQGRSQRFFILLCLYFISSNMVWTGGRGGGGGGRNPSTKLKGLFYTKVVPASTPLGQTGHYSGSLLPDSCLIAPSLGPWERPGAPLKWGVTVVLFRQCGGVQRPSREPTALQDHPSHSVNLTASMGVTASNSPDPRSQSSARLRPVQRVGGAAPPHFTWSPPVISVPVTFRSRRLLVLLLYL